MQATWAAEQAGHINLCLMNLHWLPDASGLKQEASLIVRFGMSCQLPRSAPA